MTKHEDLYRRRLTSPQAALRDLPKRCSVLLGIFSAQPPALVQALADRAKAGEVDEALVYYMHPTPATVEALIRPDVISHLNAKGYTRYHLDFRRTSPMTMKCCVMGW